MEMEPMDVDDGEIYEFDDLIDNRIKLNDAKDRVRAETEVLGLQETRYENNTGAFLTGIDIFSEEETRKKEERAKRFGLSDKGNNLSTEKEDLYSSLGVDEDSENVKNLRLSVIHMRGTEDMSTKDVFKYFEHYAPSSIEWINDVSCNVVWLDSITAARALKGLSKKIVGLKEHYKKTETDDLVEIAEDEEMTTENENAIHIKDIKYPLPPGQWRKGVDCSQSKNIFLRFATYADKKPHNAEKMSDYYKKYGNPNFGGERGLISQSRKRIYKQMNRSSESATESKPKGKNPWGDLCHTWGVNDSVEAEFVPRMSSPPREPVMRSSVRDRLGVKIPRFEKEDSPESKSSDEESNSESDSDENWKGKSKVLRMRMHADDEEVKIKKKRAKVEPKSDDLRSKLRGSRKESLAVPRDGIQVVVMNTRAIKKDPEEEDSETEEGEIVDESDSEKDKEEEAMDDGESEVEVEVEEESSDESEEESGSESSSSSEVSEKEIQGPKGSVVKTVPKQKPKLASTVWSRLNQTKKIQSTVQRKPDSDQRTHPVRDLRHQIKGDLRSRLGNSIRGRSPLRIEVRNDKCA